VNYRRNSFDIYAQQLLRNQPYPPRSLDWFVFLHVLLDPVMLLLWLYALVSAIMGWYAFRPLPVYWTGTIVPLTLLIGSVIAFVLPFYTVWRLNRALRLGVYCEAVVTDIYQRHKRFEKSIYGVVQGQLSLITADGYFTSNFDLDRKWAEKVEIGDKLAVVLYPTKLKIWIIAGPIS